MKNVVWLLVVMSLVLTGCQTGRKVKTVSTIVPTMQDVDIDGSGIIDVNDMNIMASEWGKTGKDLKSDFDGDCFVGLKDLAIIADFWLEERENVGK